MKKFIFLILVFLILFVVNVYCQYNITIDSPDSNLSVQCYFPFDTFANNDIPTKINRDHVTKQWQIIIMHPKSVMVKMMLNSRTVVLCAQKNDSIHIVAEKYTKQGGIPIPEFSGTNASGLDYYNNIYTEQGVSRRDLLKSIFADQTTPINTILANLNQQIDADSEWIDRFSKNHEVTDVFVQLFKSNIIARYAFSIEMAKKNYCAVLEEEPFIETNIKIRDFLTQKINKAGNHINYCVDAITYYNHYYKLGQKKNSTIKDTASVLIPSEFGHLAAAPADIRAYIIGSQLVTFRSFVPTMFPFCELYKRYIEIYEHAEIEAHMQKTNPCIVTDSVGVFIKNAYETTLDQLIQDHFRGKRLYIDLWATWCVPCQMEFVHYNENFYQFLKQYKVTNVFLSIDEDSRHQKWQDAVKKLQLKGYHIRLNSVLKASVKNDIFKGDVMAIPRYLLVDEHGRIIAENASRPANVKSEIANFFKE